MNVRWEIIIKKKLSDWKVGEGEVLTLTGIIFYLINSEASSPSCCQLFNFHYADTGCKLLHNSI